MFCFSLKAGLLAINCFPSTENVYFFFIPKVYFAGYRTESWLFFVYEKCYATSFWSLWFVMRNPLLFKFVFLYTWCALSLLPKYIFFVFNFQKLIKHLGMDFFGFIFCIHLASWICRIISSTKFGAFSAIISLNKMFVSFLSFEIPMREMLALSSTILWFKIREMLAVLFLSNRSLRLFTFYFQSILLLR